MTSQTTKKTGVVDRVGPEGNEIAMGGLPRLTLSGARIVPIGAEAADAFLGRYGERGLDETWVAFGAVQDDGPLMGVAVLGASSADECRVTVVVAPASRRLGLGTDLLHALAADARHRNLSQLRLSYSADALATDALIESCGLAGVRKVLNGVVTAVLFLRAG